jgi:hypothetical protein
MKADIVCAVALGDLSLPDAKSFCLGAALHVFLLTAGDCELSASAKGTAIDGDGSGGAARQNVIDGFFASAGTFATEQIAESSPCGFSGDFEAVAALEAADGIARLSTSDAIRIASIAALAIKLTLKAKVCIACVSETGANDNTDG